MAKHQRNQFEIPYDNILDITKDKTRKRKGETILVRPKTYLGTALSNEFLQCYKQCISALAAANTKSLTSGITNKSFFAFTFQNKTSRPVNSTLFNNADLVVGKDLFGAPITKVDQFFNNLFAGSINNQSAIDITEALYKIVIVFGCCTDLFSKSGPKQVGTYFEKLVGHLYATHLHMEPTEKLSTIPLDGKKESIPADYVFNTGVDQAKYHVPAKFSSRDRSVQVWAQQRLIDGAYGVGRFHCLLTCCNETDYNNGKVTEVCVSGQWRNYQLYIAQILRAYYLDLPNAYANLSTSYPPIHAKIFGEFFHESTTLVP